ncbi:XRE family transcriptional regulator [Bacillus safensis]|uniref:XRE family transcriptional regulator n=1 Tax=Bacillus safensis TaxID=561879 RepID=UPI002041B8F5|nr:XRE family transcriptional regulator [Bacillus safensis]MCM2991003.1 XRE family transcriptional regulator [Bacillus safensis]
MKIYEKSAYCKEKHKPIWRKNWYKYTSGYANVEMGRTKPSLEIAKHIADLLNTGVQELFFGQKLHEKSKCLREDRFLEKERRAE